VPAAAGLETGGVSPAPRPGTVSDLERDRREDEMTNGTVREAMTGSPAAVQSGQTAAEAARLLASEDVGSLPVVEDGRLVGMVTDRDLVVRVLAKDLDAHEVRVSEVCSADPVVVSPDEALDAALARMAREQVRRLPVVDDGRLVGIVAQADVARTADPSSTGAMVEEISEEG
jgi:CBS domain-containing protein